MDKTNRRIMKYLILTKKEFEKNKLKIKKHTKFEILKVSDQYIIVKSGIYTLKINYKEYEEYFYDKFV